MAISIAVRSRDDKNINRVLEKLDGLVMPEDQILLLDSSETHTLPEYANKIDVIKFKKKKYDDRLEKKIAAVDHATGEGILFLDADQVISGGLLQELRALKNTAAVIPERSFNRNFVGRLMDRRRTTVERKAQEQNFYPMGLTIPRYFNRNVLKAAVSRIDLDFSKTSTAHEDSIIFYEYHKLSDKIAFTDNIIFNIDPGFYDFIKKSYRVGVYNGEALSATDYPDEYKTLVKRLNSRRKIYDGKSLTEGGFLVDMLKFVPSVAGIVVGRYLRPKSTNNPEDWHEE